MATVAKKSTIRVVRLSDGTTYRHGRTTWTADVRGVAPADGAAWLHVSETGLACLEHAPTPDGSVLAVRCPPEKVAAILEALNAARAAAGNEPLTLPTETRRGLRHALAARSTKRPWEWDNAEAFPGRTLGHERETMWIHRVTGMATLETNSELEWVPALRFKRPDDDRHWEPFDLSDTLAWLTREGYPIPSRLVSQALDKGGANEPGPRSS